MERQARLIDWKAHHREKKKDCQNEIYRFNTIIVNILAKLYKDIDKIILKSI